MNKDEREQSLINARIAYKWLKEYIVRLEGPTHNQIACLLFEFNRLDEQEQARIKGGAKGKKYGPLGAVHGMKGGRPKKNGGKK